MCIIAPIFGRGTEKTGGIALAEKELSVKMLGEFCLSCGKATVSMSGSRSYKTWLMLAYLLSHRHRWVPQDEIIDILGGGDKNSNPTGAVRATLFRARRALEPISEEVNENLVISRGGSVRWNPRIKMTVDAEMFESLVRFGLSSTGDERLSKLEKAISMMPGDFLFGFSGESWVSPLAAYYKNLLVEAASAAIELYAERGKTDELRATALRAFEADPYSDAFCRHLMKAYMSAGAYEAAEETYCFFRDRLAGDLGVEPEDETRALFSSAVMRRGEKRLTLEAIKSDLRESSPPKGPILCDYSTFKLFYRAEARGADRRGDAIHVGLLTVTGKNGRQISDRILLRAMDDLKETIRATLRFGDVAASCSGSQFLILLVQANRENSEMVVRRVIDRFECDNPRSQAEVKGDVMPLEPILA